MHELLGEELANAGAQDGPAIGAAAVGGGAPALELHLPALALKEAFKDRDRPPVAVAIAGAEGALLDVLRAVDREGIARGPAIGPHGSSRHPAVTGEEPAEVLVMGQAVA